MVDKTPPDQFSVAGAYEHVGAKVGTHSVADSGLTSATPVSLQELTLYSIYFGTSNSSTDLDDTNTYTVPAGLRDRIVTYGFFPEGATGVVNVASYVKSTGVFTFGAQTGSTTNKSGWLVLGCRG